MSGETFEGKNFFINEIAETIDQYINPNNIKYHENKDWIESELTKESILELEKIRDSLIKLSNLTYHASMLLAGDYSSETFLKRIKENE